MSDDDDDWDHDDHNGDVEAFDDLLDFDDEENDIGASESLVHALLTHHDDHQALPGAVGATKYSADDAADVDEGNPLGGERQEQKQLKERKTSVLDVLAQSQADQMVLKCSVRMQDLKSKMRKKTQQNVLSKMSVLSTLQKSLSTSKKSPLSPTGGGAAASLWKKKTTAPAEEEEEEAAEPPGADTETLMDFIAQIEEIRTSVKELSEKGSPSDEELAELEKEKEYLSEFKIDVSEQIKEFEKKATIPQGGEEEGTVWDFIESLLQESDIPHGNTELMGAILEKVGTDIPALVEERGLCAQAASDSSFHYLKMLLEVPKMKFRDTVEVLGSCFFNQTHRIPLALLVLSQPESLLNLTSAADDLSELWQEFYEDIASKKRIIPKEDRTGRMELLELMLACPYFDLAIETEGGDSQCLISRACADGDLPLVQLILKHKTMAEPNRGKHAGMTTFHLAVVGNNVNIVKLLVEKNPTIDIHLVSENGNALDLAIMLHRAPAIIEFLKERGVKGTGVAPTPRGPSKGKRAMKRVMLVMKAVGPPPSLFRGDVSGVAISDDQLRYQFDNYDSNKNGHLDLKEFKVIYQGFEHYGLEPSNADMEKVFRKYSNGADTIDFEGFSVMMLERSRM